MTQPATVTVMRVTATLDGNWLIVANTGASGSSPVEIPVGSRVIIQRGVARKVA